MDFIIGKAGQGIAVTRLSLVLLAFEFFPGCFTYKPFSSQHSLQLFQGHSLKISHDTQPSKISACL